MGGLRTTLRHLALLSVCGDAAIWGEYREDDEVGQARMSSRSLRMSKLSWGPGEGSEQDWGATTCLIYHVQDLLTKNSKESCPNKGTEPKILPHLIFPPPLVKPIVYSLHLQS